MGDELFLPAVNAFYRALQHQTLEQDVFATPEHPMFYVQA